MTGAERPQKGTLRDRERVRVWTGVQKDRGQLGKNKSHGVREKWEREAER